MTTGRITHQFFTVSDVLVLAATEDVVHIIILSPQQDGNVTDEDENEGDTVPHDVPGM